jgi:hypothetical protein
MILPIVAVPTTPSADTGGSIGSASSTAPTGAHRMAGSQLVPATSCSAVSAMSAFFIGLLTPICR